MFAIHYNYSVCAIDSATDLQVESLPHRIHVATSDQCIVGQKLNTRLNISTAVHRALITIIEALLLQECEVPARSISHYPTPPTHFQRHYLHDTTNSKTDCSKLGKN